MNWLDKLLGKSDLIAVEEPPALHPDQGLRKERSEEVLRKQRVPINAWLPCIESEAEVEPRNPREVANRLLALCAVSLKGQGLEHDEVQRFIETFGVAPHLSPKERAFIADPKSSMNDRIQFSWRYEAATPLFWALNLTDAPLGAPRDVCDTAALTAIIKQTADLTHRGLRPMREILDEADLIYRYHWAVRQAGLDRKPAPAGLDGGVTMERHHGLNWLIGYNDRADWDEVSTDT
jgi:hypothetical protein